MPSGMVQWDRLTPLLLALDQHGLSQTSSGRSKSLLWCEPRFSCGPSSRDDPNTPPVAGVLVLEYLATCLSKSKIKAEWAAEMTVGRGRIIGGLPKFRRIGKEAAGGKVNLTPSVAVEKTNNLDCGPYPRRPGDAQTRKSGNNSGQ